MGDFELMNSFQPFNNLNKDIPNIFLFKMMAFSFELKYFLQQISTISVLHHDTIINTLLTKDSDY